MANEEKRGARKVRKGTVVSKMGAKSVVVQVTYRERHPVYGKVVVRSKKYHAHDEADTAKVGDAVTIMETRPLQTSSLRTTRAPSARCASAFSSSARSTRISAT